jgi:hypothetical protein
MNQNSPDFDKFLAAARRGQRESRAEIPFGFATRVASRWAASKEDRLALWERLARWGALSASVIAIAVAVCARDNSSSNPLAELADEAEETESFW